MLFSQFVSICVLNTTLWFTGLKERFRNYVIENNLLVCSVTAGNNLLLTAMPISWHAHSTNTVSNAQENKHFQSNVWIITSIFVHYSSKFLNLIQFETLKTALFYFFLFRFTVCWQLMKSLCETLKMVRVKGQNTALGLLETIRSFYSLVTISKTTLSHNVERHNRHLYRCRYIQSQKQCKDIIRKVILHWCVHRMKTYIEEGLVLKRYISL